MLLSKERRKSLESKALALAENVDAAASYLATRGLNKEVAEQFTLGCVPAGQDYAGRLSIPYITPNGVVQIKYRCTDMSHEQDGKHNCKAKYIYEAGCGTHLYNARALIGASEYVILTEGEIDALSVQGLTGIPAVGYPGVKNWKPFYRLCFTGVSEIVVLADGDDVGRETARRIAEMIGMSARVVDLGDGYDANSFIHEQGVAPFLERLLS